MIEVLMIAAGVLAGLDPIRALLLAGAVFAPVPWLALAGLVTWRSRPGVSAPAVSFCDSVAAELRAGSSLRTAIAASAGPAGAGGLAEAAAGVAPYEELAAEARSAFPQIGPELELTIPALARTGSGGADLFDEIGSLALAEYEIGREVRIASAPARATAAVFVLAPTAYLVAQARSEGLAGLFTHPEQGLVAGVGLGLFTAGLLAAGMIMKRSR